MFRVLLLSLLFASTIVHASKDKGVYIGGGVSLANVGVADPFSNKVQFKTGEVLLGYKHHPYVGIEVRAGASLHDERIRVNEEGLRDSVSATIDDYYSFYYRIEAANEIAKVYGLLGRSSVSSSFEFDEDELGVIEASESGMSYGIGFGMWLDERMNLNLEFKTLLKTSTGSISSTTISADYRF